MNTNFVRSAVDLVDAEPSIEFLTVGDYAVQATTINAVAAQCAELASVGLAQLFDRLTALNRNVVAVDLDPLAEGAPD